MPDERLFGVCVNILFFKIAHEYIGLAWGYLCVHGCATYLQIIFIIELGIIACEGKLQ